MLLSPALRKINLTAHVTSSVGWFGALLVFLAHAVASLSVQDDVLQRAMCIAMGVTAWAVILPLSLASFLTGVVQALGTAWGLVRHYWVVAKLMLTVLATTILLLKLAPISELAQAARTVTFTQSSTLDLKLSMTVHAAGGLIVLLLTLILAIYKPAGVTRFGRRGRAGPAGQATDAVAGPLPGWVRAAGWATLALGLALLLLLHGGRGPGIHGLNG